MSEFAWSRAGEDTDLLCVEVSALGAAVPAPCALPKENCGGQETPSCTADQTKEEFLRSLLLKTDTYRPQQSSLAYMDNKDFLAMRKAVVHWFANVAISYEFGNETVVAALSNFDRYVAVTLEPVANHLLLQLAAYVALLVASKMGEVAPLRMKSLANLTGRMFTPLQVQKCELDMISKLHFRLAPPSADETLHCLATLIHTSWPTEVSTADVLSTSSCYLKKARVRTCWFRHSPYTLAVAALATAYNSLGLGHLKRSLLRECDSRARVVTGKGVDLRGVAACAAAMSADERAASDAAAAAAARACRGGTESPVCNKPSKDGWGSPTGVEQGVELVQASAFSTVRGAEMGVSAIGAGGARAGSGGPPLVKKLSPPTTIVPKTFGPRAAPKAARAGVGNVGVVLPQAAGVDLPTVDEPTTAAPRRSHKRGFSQSFGSCFVPCARRPCVDGVGDRGRVDWCVTADDESRPLVDEKGSSDSNGRG